MEPTLSFFKPWVPEWLVRSTIFLALIPGSILLALYGATTADAAGYYGIQPSDVQFSLLLYYAGLVAYLPFDPRFSSYLPSRQYFIWALFLLVVSVVLCTLTHHVYVLYLLRFIQGCLCSAIGSPCLTLIFSRLHSTRARAMGYTFFYGALLAAAPLSAIVASLTLDRFNFPVVFHVFLLLQLPGGLLLILILNDVRLKRRLPLSQLEWPSFVLLSGALALAAYVLVYGQEREWLSDPSILGALAGLLGLAFLFGLRQHRLRRPYINLAIFRYRGFRRGLALFVLFYLCRGTTNIATAYFLNILHLDAYHLASLQLATLAGIAAGMLVVVRFVLVGAPLRSISVVGFGLMLAYHGSMYFLLGPTQSTTVFLLPLFLHGLATGTLMVPLIGYTLSSLPSHLGGSGSYAAVTVRFATYSGSMALTSYLQLAWRSAHFERLRQEIVPENFLLTSRLQHYQQGLQSRGLGPEAAEHAALGLLRNALEAQSELRFAMGYHALVSGGLVVLLAVLILLPHVQERLVSFRQRPL